MPEHQYIEGAGLDAHMAIDARLPSDREAALLRKLGAAPKAVEGARDDPEAALANLLAALEALGLIADSTTAT